MSISFFYFDRLSLKDNDSESSYVSVDLRRALSTTNKKSASKEYKALIYYSNISCKNSISNNSSYKLDNKDNKKVPNI
ncbi:hypothetical protein HBI54_111080 [Parastagonospora nodorum]|nr:hypothetical protein HBI54_111080 [Parastagonospora nodorum]